VCYLHNTGPGGQQPRQRACCPAYAAGWFA
jgi:hypothetical protein